MERKVKEVDTTFRKAQYLAEEYQANKTQFALCRYDEKKKVLIQCHQFVHCRDFMLDVLVGAEQNKLMSIYGFVYGPTDPRPDVENVSLMLLLEGKGALKNFQDNFPILKGIEESLGWCTSYVDLVEYPTKNGPSSVVVWVLGDSSWQKSALSFSLYTYLLKCLTYKIEDKSKWMDYIKGAGTTESEYLDHAYLNFLFQNLNSILPLYKGFSGYPKDTPTRTIHNSSGFISLKHVILGKDRAPSGHDLSSWKVPK